MSRYQISILYNLLILQVLFAIVAFLPAAEIHTLDGSHLKVGNFSVKNGQLKAGETIIPLQEVTECTWGNQANKDKGEKLPVFHLRNGDRLSGTILKSEDENISITSTGFGAVSISLGDLERIVLNSDPPKTMQTAPKGKDSVLFLNGDSLNGVIRQILPEGIVFESVIGKMKYDFSQLRMVSFQALPITEKVNDSVYFVLNTVQGEVLSGTAINVTGDQVIVSSHLFGNVRSSTSNLEGFTVANGRLIYLAELEPVDIDERSIWDGGYVWRFRKDRSIDGNQLILNGRKYSRGFGVHSYCSLVFKLDRKYQTFFSDFGIDDEITQYGSVDCIVKGDGKVLFELKDIRFDSETVKIRIDIQNISRLELIVDYGAYFDIGDHADWADPCLVRKP